MVTVEGAKLLMFQDVFILQTPGGGGWGSPDQTPDHTPVLSSDHAPVLSSVSRPVLSRGSVAEYRRLQESA